jgi:hypothetical protein
MQMAYEGVSIQQVAGTSGLQNLYTQRSLSGIAAENELLWLIQVGLLRREVDGQGLTDSFRLTPLGRQLVQQWQSTLSSSSPRSTFFDHFYNALNRWLRFSF